MSKVIEHGHREENVTYSFVFDRGDGSGFGFNSTPDGDILLDWENVEIQADSYLHCLTEVEAGRMRKIGLREYRNTYWVSTIIACNNCDKPVELWSHLYNECECGVGYNASGQQLAPVSQWEENDRYGTFGPQNFPDSYDGDY